jgi:hypothetical protein
MKALAMSLLIATAVTSSAAIAKDQAKQSPSTVQLERALSAVAATVNSQDPPPPEHFNPKTDKDQGDDHANPGAIAKVCSKNTPAAHRSAICPVGVSPQ